MSELNVTPGEWFASGTSVMSTWLTQIAETSSAKINVNESEANAHLMAASKELYEALVLAREYASEEIARRQDAGMDTSLDVGYLKQIDAALAKARGEAGDE